MKRLVLLGGGHAHLAVLKALAERPLDGWQVQLVTPFRRQIYSGMLPGWVAGHYAIHDCAIALDALAARGRVALTLTACTGLDLSANTVACADGSTLPFDLLSIDTGPEPAVHSLPGALDHALPIRPIEGFVAAWPGIVDRIAARRQRFELVVLGAGAAGVELALATQRRAQAEGWSHLQITLIGSAALPLEGVAGNARRQMARLLAQRGIRWIGERRAARIAPGRIDFAQGASVGFDACLAVTGAAAPAWPAAAGLATDPAGFIRVGRTLQTMRHSHVLAAGDVAAYQEARPKSGVFAVRAGPILAHNLRALCQGEVPTRWTPQQRALYLISTGDQRAVAAWGRWAWRGAWVWRWKDRIDRQFVARFGADAASGGWKDGPNDPMTTFPTHSDAWARQRLEVPLPGRRPRIVIDTDTANEVDDQFALAWALLSPDALGVEAMYAAPFSFAHRRGLLPNAPSNAAPFDPPHIGMERSYDEIERVYSLLSLPSSGRVYRGSAGYLASPTEARRSAACDHLIALARSAEPAHPLYVVALGCVTNIASALLLAPDIVDRIVVVWTSGYPSSAPHVNASFNLEQDPAASRLLFDSGVPLVYLPGYHVGAQLRLSSIEVEHYVKGCGAIGDALHRLYANNPLWSILGHDASRPYSWVIWDLICVAWLIQPDWVPSTLVRTPKLDAELRWVPSAGRPWMREGHAVQRDAIFNDFFAKLAHLKARQPQ